MDSNQPAPEYVESNAKPDVSEVRLILTQPVTTDLDDLDLFIARQGRRVQGALDGERGDHGYDSAVRVHRTAVV